MSLIHGQRMTMMPQRLHFLSAALKAWKSDIVRTIVIALLTYVARYMLLLCLLTMSVQSMSTALQRNYLHDTEHLQYRVSWGFFRLGTVEIMQRMKDAADSTVQVDLVARSNPQIPFIDVSIRSRSQLYTSDWSSERFLASFDRTGRKRTTHELLPQRTRTVVQDWLDTTVTKTDTLTHNGVVYDEEGLLMLIRSLSGRDTSLYVHSIIDGKICTTELRFASKVEMIRLTDQQRKVPAFPFAGSGTWNASSYAGLSGQFCGWVSVDSASIPLRIEAKIFLGSVVLELESHVLSSNISRSHESR